MMNKEQIALAVSLQALNCFNLDSLRNRILLQKKVYLAQLLGLGLGYRFSWYIHGPYSPDLAAVAYETIPTGVDSFIEYNLTDEAKGVTERVNNLKDELFAIDSSFKDDEPSAYELLASVAYLKKNRRLDVTEIKKQLQIEKPRFSADQITTSYDLLDENEI